MRSTMLRCVVLCLAALLSAALCGAERLDGSDSPPVSITRDAERIEIGNRFLARTFRLRPCLATCAVTNRLTGTRLEVQGADFVLDLGEGRSLEAGQFVLDDTEAEPSAGRLVFHLQHKDSGIRATVGYELGPDDFFLRKRLKLETGSVYVRGVDVERIAFGRAKLGPLLADRLNAAPQEPRDHLEHAPAPSIWDIGLGQPVFVADELFLGLEHPAGHNGYDAAGVVFLRHWPGRAGEIECKPAVLGVAANRPRERVQDAFLQYIAVLRKRPVARWTEFFFDAHEFNADARRIVDSAREAFVQRGVRLDCVTINGWAEPREGIMEPARTCPDFLPQMSGYVQKRLGCGLGLHVYTTGCRSAALRDWIAARFDMAYIEPGSQGRGAYCLADPRAESLLTGNLARYVRENGVRMYYYDWGCFSCRSGSHRGHMPGYGTEAIADAFLRHLRAMREARPEMFLCDTGWFSPWWLEWYDAVFFAGGDWNADLRGPPAYATMDLLGTWRDHVMKQRLEARPWFPATGYINHGAISHNWKEWRQRAPQPRQALVSYVAMMFLLGPQIAEYILALPELSEANRDDLAAVHRWGIARDDWLLADTRPLGGDPMLGEAYGFAHVAAGNRGVIGIRNPTAVERSVRVVCDEKIGFWPEPAPLVVATTYPYTRVENAFLSYGQSLEVKLAGHELRVLEVSPLDGLPRPMTLGCREQLLESGPSRTVIGLLNHEGGAVEVISPVPMDQLLLNGMSCPIDAGARQATLHLASSATALPAVAVQNAVVRDGGPELSVRMSIDVPRGVRASLVLLLSEIRAGEGKLAASIRCGDKQLDVESPHVQLRDSAGRSSGKEALAADWSLFRAPLAEGRAEVECLLGALSEARTAPADRPPLAPWQGRLEVFVDAEHELAEQHRIEIRHAAIKDKARSPLPLDWNRVAVSRTEVVAPQQVVIETPARRRNLALATGENPPRVTVDSLFPTYTPEPVNDGLAPPRGRAGQAWASAESPQEHAVTLTWPQEQQIGTVYVCWGQDDWLPRAYRVECRVSGAWIRMAATPGDADGWQAAVRRDTLLNFDPVAADAVRVVQRAGGGSVKRPNLMGVAELAVYP